jgi:hypothetical protein
VQLAPPARAALLSATEFAVETAEPPQLLARLLGAAATRPAGKVSLKAIPVSGTDAFGLVTVKVNDVEPFNGTDAAPNALLKVGGATTVMEEVEVFPVPPSVEVTVTLLLFTPAVVPVTFTLKVHCVLVARLAPLRAMEPAPETAVIVPPPQEPVSPLGLATVRPAGRVSVNPTPPKVMLPGGLAIVNVSEVDPPTGMVAAPKPLVMLGGDATVRLAVAVAPVPPLVEVTLPVVFVN